MGMLCCTILTLSVHGIGSVYAVQSFPGSVVSVSAQFSVALRKSISKHLLSRNELVLELLFSIWVFASKILLCEL